MQEDEKVSDIKGGDVNEDNIGGLASERLQMLQDLLDKAGLYSKFLSKNMMATASKSENDTDAVQDEEERPKRRRNARKRAANRNQNSNGVKKLKQAQAMAAEVDGKAIMEQPELLTGGTLRFYQLEGIRWLCNLYENGLNGILADEMGLGKTIQIIGLIAHLRSQGVNGPFLIVAPLSTLRNWNNEFTKWTPTIPSLVYHGSSKDARRQIRAEHLKSSRQNEKDFPVVITSYEIIMQDFGAFNRLKLRWKYLVVDEGHRLKNFNCRLIRNLKLCPSENRLLLTGTPLQNNLMELWSLLNFILPDVFDNLNLFESWFSLGPGPSGSIVPTANSKQGGEENSEPRDADVQGLTGSKKAEFIGKLHEILRPFLLRRLKTDVIELMPKKVEIYVYCSMTALQKDYYSQIINGTLVATLEKKYGAKLARLGAGRYTKSIRNRIMQLRKCCNHPYLFAEDENEEDNDLDSSAPSTRRNTNSAWKADSIHHNHLIQAAGKLIKLDQMLQLLKRNGHKVLLFSQMTRILDILEDFMILRKYEYCRLDGNTDLNSRQNQMDEFNQSLRKTQAKNSKQKTKADKFCFLLSTRAGGLGINLVAADTVIFYDSDWNPQQDNQAQDRCHRIGQTKDVVVYRLITENSVETRMIQRALEKRKLERVIIHRGNFKSVAGYDLSDGDRKKQGWKQLTDEELQEMLRDDIYMLANGLDTGGIALEELERICNRSSVMNGAFSPSLTNGENGSSALPRKGKGYEFIDDFGAQDVAILP